MNVNAKGSDGLTPLTAAAAFNNNPDVVTTLLRAGVDIEARASGNFHSPQGGTALLWAAWFNENPDVIAALLKAGADPNAKDSRFGSTALFGAAPPF